MTPVSWSEGHEEQLKANQRTSSHDYFNKQIFAHPRLAKAGKLRWNHRNDLCKQRGNFFQLRDLWFQWKAINPFVSFYLLRFYQFSSDNKSFWPFHGVHRNMPLFHHRKCQEKIRTLQVSYQIKSDKFYGKIIFYVTKNGLRQIQIIQFI